MDTKIISFISPLKRKTESEIEISKVENVQLINLEHDTSNIHLDCSYYKIAVQFIP